MVQAILSNLGILLLMHLMINTCLYLNQTKKIHDTLIPIIHIAIVTGTVITMFYFPINYQGLNFDFRLVPLIFLALFHGWKYTIPVVLIVSVYLGLAEGNMNIQEVLFTTMFPPFMALLSYPLNRNKMHYLKTFWIIIVSWLVSDLAIVLASPSGLAIFQELALIRASSILLCSYILYFFIYSGTAHLQLTKQLQVYAESDPLTGLYNMRKFEKVLSSFEPGLKRMFIAMVDIDRFKKINDLYGHQVGDQAIYSVGDIICRKLQKDMFAARYGGDEFIIFIAAETREQAVDQLEEIRLEIDNQSFFRGHREISLPISLSIGVAELQQFPDLKRTIEQADQQLYRAKKMGRNCVCG
ncbi:diguanylate cyclase [Mesobacillus foraminis]|uniref:GGDEF domain-containing protein n=1 Tax=Mesobacillus foraminis TaxID=279826 RepID=UPI001BECECDC|nr:diguanylate cyclase [Mesobacillus foraminis]MBT2758389.1 diguanylate cyclase [Mesobacillus foraminis]